MIVILRVWQTVESLPDFPNTAKLVNQQYFLREDLEKAKMLEMDLNKYFYTHYNGVYKADVVEV